MRLAIIGLSAESRTELTGVHSPSVGEVVWWLLAAAVVWWLLAACVTTPSSQAACAAAASALLIRLKALGSQRGKLVNKPVRAPIYGSEA